MTTLSSAHSMPTAEEFTIARESSRALSAYLQIRAETQQIDIFDDKGASHPVRVPVSALRLLVDVLTEIGEGNAVSITLIHAELTTQHVANVRNVRALPCTAARSAHALSPDRSIPGKMDRPDSRRVDA